MINVRIANNDDKRAWNDVALKAENSTYAHTWEWKEVIEKGFGIEFLYLVAENNSGEIIGIYPGFLRPLYIKNIEFISRKFKVFESPFYMTWDYGGPCVLPSADEGTLELLIAQMERFARQKGALSLRLSPFEGDDLKKMFVKRGYRISERLTSVIDLTISEQELWERLNKKTRTPIRKAKKLEVEITQDNTEFALNVLFNTMNSLSDFKEFDVPQFDFYKNALDGPGEKGMVKIYLANHQDKPIGAALVLCYKDMIVTRYWAILPEYRSLQANNLLVWEIIMDGKKNGYKKCDLGGMPSDEKDGIYIFKSGWKGEIRNVDWYVKNVRFACMMELYRYIKSGIK